MTIGVQASHHYEARSPLGRHLRTFMVKSHAEEYRKAFPNTRIVEVTTFEKEV